MMNTKNALLMSVAAAALIAGAGVGIGAASAQTPPSPATQQTAPAEKPGHEPKATSQNNAPDAGVKSGKAEDKTEHKGSKAEHAQDAPKADVKPNGIRSETKSPGKTGSEVQADPKNKADMRSPEKPGDAKVRTTDQGAAGGSVKLSAEQHTTMRAAIKQHNVQPMTNVNFSISVGSRVPRTVHFYPVPEEIVLFYPRWRGYDYFLVGDQIIVVNPRTHEIVAVLDA
jgi:hypothetical protein